MNLPRVTLGSATTILLALAAVAGLGGWQLQAGAGRALEDARTIQLREVKESDSAPPTPKDNRRIIESLTESIAIRKHIDGILARIERDVRYLQSREEQAQDITQLVREQLDLIARSLGSAVASSRASITELGDLDESLARSARLARLIAEELEELDRKMGPSAGNRP
jgi:hypothetical protein